MYGWKPLLLAHHAAAAEFRTAVYTAFLFVHQVTAAEKKKSRVRLARSLGPIPVTIVSSTPIGQREVLALQTQCGTRVAAAVLQHHPHCALLYCGRAAERPARGVPVPLEELRELTAALHVWGQDPVRQVYPAPVLDQRTLRAANGQTFEAVLAAVHAHVPNARLAHAVLSECVFEDPVSKCLVRWVDKGRFVYCARDPVVVLVDGRSAAGRGFASLVEAMPPHVVLVGFALSSRQRKAAARSCRGARTRLARGRTPRL